MQPLNRSNRCWVLLLAGVLVGISGGAALLAQDAEADQAQALLKHGIAQYKARNFTDAQAALLKADVSKLSDSQRKQRDSYLAQAGEAIRKQAQAMEAYDSAQQALKANDLEKALALFKQAADSEFLPDPVRLDARAQQAEVVRKIAAAKAAAEAAQKQPEPTKQPDPTKQPEPTPEPGLPDVPPLVKPTVQPDVPKIPAPPTQPTQPERIEAEAQARLIALQRRINMAKAEVALGNEALGREQVDRAIQHFEKALVIAPEYEPATKRLAYARGLVGEVGGGEGAISRLEQKLRIQKQKVELLYSQAMQRAREAKRAARNAADFERAIQEVKYAQTQLAANKSLFPDAEYRSKRLETDELLDAIDLQKTEWQKRRVIDIIAEIEQKKRQREAEAKRQKAEKIGTLKEQVRALRAEGKFNEAAEICDRIRKLEPDDTWAREWYEQLTRFVLLLEEKQAHSDGMREEQKQLVGNRISQIPWYELLRYPRDWTQITQRRGPFGAGQVAESEVDRLVRRELRKILPRLEFPGIGFKDVIDFFRDVSTLNIHPKWEVLRASGIDEKTPVDLKLTNVSLEKALRTVLDDVGGVSELDFIVDEGVITISTKDDLARQTITRVYDIRDLIFQVPNFPGPTIQSDTDTGEAGEGTTGATTSAEELFQSPEEGQPTEGVSGSMSRRDLVNSILETVQASVAPDSWRPSGLVGSIRELNGQIVVTQTPKNHRMLLDLLAQLREARAILINVEARFINVNSGFLHRVGISFDFYFNIGSRLGSAWTVDPWTSAVIPYDGGPSGWGSGPSWHNLTPIGVQQGSYGWVYPFGGLPTAIADSIGNVTTNALSIAGTFLDDIQVDFLVAATQAHQSTRSLTAPRVTFFNGQRAYVAVQIRRAYVSDLDPVVSENATSFDPTISYINTGAVLDVEGTVSADRRYVTLTLRPEVTGNVTWFEYAIARTTETVDTTETLTTIGIIQVPQIEVNQIRCTVSVPDKGTLLLGGLKLAGEREREMGVPILSKIPILNRLFTNKVLVRDDETLLILVRPQIIIQREYEEQAFPP